MGKKRINTLDYGISFLIFLFVFSSFAYSFETQNSTAEMLFTPQEADKLDLSGLKGEEWDLYVNTNMGLPEGKYQPKGLYKIKGTDNGPKIKITYPLVQETIDGPRIETRSPTKINVIFLQNELGNPVDMTTLEVIGKKGFFTKKLTDKFKPYISGTTIEVPPIKVPKGKFHLKVSIADAQGLKTLENYLLVVK